MALLTCRVGKRKQDVREGILLVMPYQTRIYGVPNNSFFFLLLCYVRIIIFIPPFFNMTLN